MTNIDKHIASLLHHYDCVIIPDFGGFITSDKSGYVDSKAGVFNPPYKQILFNRNLTNNDGLLANQIASEEDNINYYEANLLLNQFKEACYARLNSEGRVEIEKVGVLFFDAEKNIQFQQSSKNFLLSSFGLSPKFLIPLPIEKEVVVKKEIPVEKKVVVKPIQEEKVLVNRPSAKPEPTKKKKSRKGVWVSLIAIPLVVGGLFFANQMGYVGESKLQLSNLNPFKSQEQQVYSPRTSSFELILSGLQEEKVVGNEEVLTSVKEELEVIPEKVDSTYVHKEIIKEVVHEDTSKPYHVIGGCFSDKSNAEGLVKTWKEKGEEASIVDMKGNLYRVSLNSFASRTEANQFRDKVEYEAGISTWILKK